MFWNKECDNIHFLTTVQAVRCLLRPVLVLRRSDKVVFTVVEVLWRFVEACFSTMLVYSCLSARNSR